VVKKARKWNYEIRRGSRGLELKVQKKKLTKRQKGEEGGGKEVNNTWEKKKKKIKK